MLAPISHIVCADRIRGITPEKVAALAASISEVGLLNPLSVCITPVVRGGQAQDGYMLIGGAHRLEAVKSLGWDKVAVTVTELSGPAATIAECDENLCGSNLSASERALFTKRRKEAYEALHPETRATSDGGDGRHKATRRQLGDDIANRFTADTASRTGQSERVVQRDAERGKKIDPDVLSSIVGTKLDTGRTLDALASTPREMQASKVEELRLAKAARLLAEDEAKEVRKANSATDAIVKDRRLEIAKEWLAARLDVDELHQLGEMLAGLCDPLSRVLMREAA